MGARIESLAPEKFSGDILSPSGLFTVIFLLVYFESPGVVRETIILFPARELEKPASALMSVLRAPATLALFSPLTVKSSPAVKVTVFQPAPMEMDLACS